MTTDRESVGQAGPGGMRRHGPRGRTAVALTAALGVWLAAAAASAVSPWVTLGGCSLEAWDGNDGDSFLIKCPDLKPEKDILKVFRLYYVDTPESEESLPQRLEDQRAYWDLPNVQTVVKCGEKAKQFTKHFLGSRFEVHTRWETAMGRTKMGRHYAMLSVEGEDLGCALVRNGLARVYGKGPDLDGLKEYRSAAANAWWEKLRQAEALAKREKKGCWAYSGKKGARAAAGEEAAAGDAGGIGIAAGDAGARTLHGRGTVGPRLRAPLPAYGGGLAAGLGAAAAATGAAAAASPAGYPLEVRTTKPLYIYPAGASLAAAPMGRLKEGMAVQVLGDATAAGRVRVRFRLSTGAVHDGEARKADLGLP